MPTVRSLFVAAVFAVSLLEFHGGNRLQADDIASEPVLELQIPDEPDAALEEFRSRVYLATQRQAHYLLDLVHPWSADESMALLTDSRSTEHWIRPNTGALIGFCFLHRFGPYDTTIVGTDREALLEKTILPMFRYLVATHLTGDRATSDGQPWGDHWQSAHWAQMMGRGAWWIWDDLPTDLRRDVRRVVEHEADRFVRATPPHRIQEDTKAEENAWNAQIFSVAILLSPADARRPDWEAAFQRWCMSSFLRPADAECDRLIDGRPVREQFHGANIYDDFTLENHGFVHPDYMTCIGLSMGCALDYRMSGREPPDSLKYNTAEIYENLKWFILPDGGYVYPNGQDWTLFRNPGWLGIHTLMAAYGRDPDAWQYAQRSLECLEKMQARSQSGQIYLPSEFFFPSTQTDRLYSLASVWLWLRLADGIVDQHQPRTGVRRLDAAKIVLNRTPTSIHTVAWGARCMAQCVPLRMDRIVSPDMRNGIGEIRLSNSDKPLPVQVRKVQVDADEGAFAVQVTLEHGRGQFSADLTFESSVDGTWTMREKLTALTEVTTADIATGQVGILNNPDWVYERGHRFLAIDDETTEVPAHSGKRIDASDVLKVAIDDTLSIESDSPLEVRYVGATGPVRGRATDMLYLNSVGGERSWQPGQVVSEYSVTVKVH